MVLYYCLYIFCFHNFCLVQPDITPTANGSAANRHLMANGGPGTLLPCSPETPLVNGVANGHMSPMQDSPFIGYIIAMHRKMVRTGQKSSQY